MSSVRLYTVPLEPVILPGHRSRAQELYNWLRAAILSGELQPHERLVETTIAELASVSRTPVREALHRLEVDGLIGEGANGGLEVIGFSLDELADLCAVRETLEGMAAELAAVSRSEMEIATLRSIVGAEEEAVGAANLPIEQLIEMNHTFHETLWRASRNRYLADELRHLRSLIERLQETTLRSADRLEQAVAEHKAIVDALAERDSARAGELTRRHFRNAMAKRLAMFHGASAAASTWPATPVG
jgi:DNA-binding GntR family transcriptional regulator